MLKQITKSFPPMFFALLVNIATTIIDGIVYVRMMGLLDLALAGRTDEIIPGAKAMLVFALLLVPLGLLSALTKSFYRKDAAVRMRSYYLRRVFRKNISEFQKENTANYISRLTNDMNTLDNNFVNGIYTVGSGLASFFVGVWMITTVNPWMILFSIAVAVINILISMFTQKPATKAYKERSDMFDGYTSYIKEVLSAFHIVRSNHLTEKITEDYHKKSDEIQQKGYFIERLMTFINAAQNFTMNTSFYAIMCILGYFALRGLITAAGLLTVSEGMMRMTWPLFQLSEALPKLFSSKDLNKKMEDSLVNADKTVETISLDGFETAIELKDVGFHYEDHNEAMENILTGVNLTLKKNGKYLIVGPSGGGKSTLLKLLRKYYRPTSGTIFIDGNPLPDVKKEDYFSLMANVEQQVFIFEDTLKNNLTLYRDCTDEALQNAIRDSGLTDFVNGLPDGLDTMIYDNGKNISGGERSRIVIARALLCKASILFMDEAFASLDMERAREIEQTILKLKDITIINVSHVIFKDTKALYDGVYTVRDGGVSAQI